jgi:hypothetical protein
MQAFGMGRFMNMTPMETAALSIQLGEALRAGGPAAGRLRSQGIVDLGRNTLNKFDNLIKVMDALAKMPEKEAGYMARELGLPGEMLMMRYLSKELRSQLMNNPPLTEEEKRQAAEKQAADEIRKRAIEGLERKFAPVVTNSALSDAAAWEGRLGDALKYGYQAIGELGRAIGPEQLYDAFWKKVFGSVKKEQEMSKAAESPLDKNTRALENATRALKKEREIIGGGRRASSAIPAGWRHEQLSEGLAGMSRTLGAFNI